MTNKKYNDVMAFRLTKDIPKQKVVDGTNFQLLPVFNTQCKYSANIDIDLKDLIDKSIDKNTNLLDEFNIDELYIDKRLSMLTGDITLSNVSYIYDFYAYIDKQYETYFGLKHE